MLAGAAPAQAATVQIGAVGPVAAGTKPQTATRFNQPVLQTLETSPLPSGFSGYAVPAGFGVVTGWSDRPVPPAAR